MRALMLALLLLTTGCDKLFGELQTGEVESQTPQWITTGSHRSGDTLYGVGAAEGIKNASLAQSTADARARAEIAKLLATTIERTGGSTRATAIATMSGVEIEKRWIDPQTNTTYALAKMKVSP